MIKDATTYEIMNPEDYGVSSVLTFGARSGSAALRGRYNAMGLEVDDFSLCAERFFTIADTRKEIDDADVVMSVYGGEIDEKYHLENFHPIVNGEFRAAVEIGLSSSKFCSISVASTAPVSLSYPHKFLYCLTLPFFNNLKQLV